MLGEGAPVPEGKQTRLPRAVPAVRSSLPRVVPVCPLARAQALGGICSGRLRERGGRAVPPSRGPRVPYRAGTSAGRRLQELGGRAALGRVPRGRWVTGASGACAPLAQAHALTNHDGNTRKPLRLAS